MSQLPLGEFERPPLEGTLLLRLRLDGKPQRAKHHPQVVARGPRKIINGEKWVRLSDVSPTTRPDPGWDEWRGEMVVDIRQLGLARIEVPVLVGVTAVFPRPKSRKKTYTLKGVERPYPYPWVPARVPFVGTPDHDQVTKAAVDVLVQAGVFLDDPLVVGYEGGRSRWYAAPGEEPHVEVRLWAA